MPIQLQHDMRVLCSIKLDMDLSIENFSQSEGSHHTRYTPQPSIICVIWLSQPSGSSCKSILVRTLWSWGSDAEQTKSILVSLFPLTLRWWSFVRLCSAPAGMDSNLLLSRNKVCRVVSKPLKAPASIFRNILFDKSNKLNRTTYGKENHILWKV